VFHTGAADTLYLPHHTWSISQTLENPAAFRPVFFIKTQNRSSAGATKEEEKAAVFTGQFGEVPSASSTGGGGRSWQRAVKSSPSRRAIMDAPATVPGLFNTLPTRVRRRSPGGL